MKESLLSVITGYRGCYDCWYRINNATAVIAPLSTVTKVQDAILKPLLLDRTLRDDVGPKCGCPSSEQRTLVYDKHIGSTYSIRSNSRVKAFASSLTRKLR